MIQDRIWISWGFQRRSYELAREFSAEYFDFSAAPSNRYVRYLQCVPKTILLLSRSRGGMVFAQNPSLLLSLIAALGTCVFRYRYVNDLHTPYLRLSPFLDRLFWRMQRFCVGRSELTIVTNGGLMKRFRGARNIAVLPDKLPGVGSPPPRALDGAVNILFPCSFAVDEPFEEVRRAAALVDADVHIYVTGRYRRAGWIPGEMPPNLHLTGFIPETEYLTLLNSVDAVLALTSQEQCLLCGAYEGVSAGKPLVLSGTQALRDYFTGGAVHVANDAESITVGIRELRRALEALRADVEKLRITLERGWREDFNAIQARLNRA